MNFKPVTAESKAIIEPYLRKSDQRGCDMTFSSIYLWRSFYNVYYAVYEDMLVFRTQKDGGDISYSLPVGHGDLAKVIDRLKEIAAEEGYQLGIHGITRDLEPKLMECCKDQYTISYDRDVADYIYEVSALSELKGKKYHGKKNHINYFKKTFDWAYETIDDSNIDECLTMLAQWRDENCDPDDREKHEEICVSKRSLLEREFLGFRGGLIRADGRVVAFSIGEKINSDTFNVHIEKADAGVRGAYPMINQQLLIHEAQDCIYVNREEDLGDEGLRKAKLSYHPCMLLEKGTAIFK